MEQELINLAGGIEMLANKRNAIARKKWKDFNVIPWQ
jgi:hypothetical protein